MGEKKQGAPDPVQEVVVPVSIQYRDCDVPFFRSGKKLLDFPFKTLRPYGPFFIFIRFFLRFLLEPFGSDHIRFMLAIVLEGNIQQTNLPGYGRIEGKPVIVILVIGKRTGPFKKAFAKHHRVSRDDIEKQQGQRAGNIAYLCIRRQEAVYDFALIQDVL